MSVASMWPHAFNISVCSTPALQALFFPPDLRSSLWSQLCPEGSLPTLNLSKPLSLTSKHTVRTALHLNQCLFSSVHHDLSLIIAQTDSKFPCSETTAKDERRVGSRDTSTPANAGKFEARLPSSVISTSSNRDWLQPPSKQSKTGCTGHRGLVWLALRGRPTEIITVSIAASAGRGQPRPPSDQRMDCWTALWLCIERRRGKWRGVLRGRIFREPGL